MSHYDHSLQSQQHHQHSRPQHNKSKPSLQPLKMSNTKTKIASSPYFRQLLLQISTKQTTKAINHFEKQISISKNQNQNQNRRTNFDNSSNKNSNLQKKQQKQDQIKYRCLSFEQFSSDYMHKMPNTHDQGLKDCFNDRPSFRIFDVQSGPFQNPQIEEQFQI